MKDISEGNTKQYQIIDVKHLPIDKMLILKKQTKLWGTLVHYDRKNSPSGVSNQLYLISNIGK